MERSMWRHRPRRRRTLKTFSKLPDLSESCCKYEIGTRRLGLALRPWSSLHTHSGRQGGGAHLERGRGRINDSGKIDVHVPDPNFRDIPADQATVQLVQYGYRRRTEPCRVRFQDRVHSGVAMQGSDLSLIDTDPDDYC